MIEVDNYSRMTMISYYRIGYSEYVAVTDRKTVDGFIGRGPAGPSGPVCNRVYTEEELAGMVRVSQKQIPAPWQAALGCKDVVNVDVAERTVGNPNIFWRIVLPIGILAALALTIWILHSK
jgi:hypothetical protein